MEVLKKNVDISTDDKLFSYLVDNNDLKFNILKAAEECSEFSEVILKVATKSEENRPPIQDAVNEYADLLYRGMIALIHIYKQQNPEAAKCQQEVESLLEKRIDYKLNKLRGYINQGIYNGGV